FTFALVGLIHPCKGHAVAIRALGRVDSARLLIVGTNGYPGYEAQCRELTHRLGLADRVEFWGYLADPYKAYLDPDAAWMCCQFEGMGRCTAEAMAACRPVIGYNNFGTAELIQHERTGLLYRGGEAELAACMRRLIENPGWARQLGENGWQSAHAKHTIEINA